jgi:hypothetical protein
MAERHPGWNSDRRLPRTRTNRVLIDQTALLLGFRAADYIYITSSYVSLYEEYGRAHQAVPGSVRSHVP